MIIRPSAAIRQNYNEIAEQCRKTVEEDRMRGNKGYSVDEVAAMMRSAIKEAADHGTAE